MAKNEFIQRLAILPLYKNINLTDAEISILSKYLNNFEAIKDDSKANFSLK